MELGLDPKSSALFPKHTIQQREINLATSATLLRPMPMGKNNGVPFCQCRHLISVLKIRASFCCFHPNPRMFSWAWKSYRKKPHLPGLTRLAGAGVFRANLTTFWYFWNHDPDILGWECQGLPSFLFKGRSHVCFEVTRCVWLYPSIGFPWINDSFLISHLFYKVGMAFLFTELWSELNALPEKSPST